MSTSIRDIRHGIQDRLDTLGTVTAYDAATGSERLSRPVAIVFPSPGGGRASAGGRYTRRFVVEVHCPLTMTLARAQDVLDDLIDDGASANVEDVIEADGTLGGVAESVAVSEFVVYAFSKLNGQDTLMLRIPVEVFHS